MQDSTLSHSPPAEHQTSSSPTGSAQHSTNVGGAQRQWRPTRKNFVPVTSLVPLVPSAPSAHQSLHRIHDVTDSFPTTRYPRNPPPGVLQTTRDGMKKRHIDEMMVFARREESTKNILQGLVQLERLPAVSDTQTAVVSSAREMKKSGGNVLEARPMTPPNFTVVEKKLGDRLDRYEAQKASMVAKEPVKPPHRVKPMQHTRRHRAVEVSTLLAKREAELRYEDELRQEAEKERLLGLGKNGAVEATGVAEAVYVNPVSQLGKHLTQHAENIISYTYNLMNATLRRVNNRSDDTEMSFKDARKIQLVNVLQKNRLVANENHQLPAIAVMGSDHVAEALQARLEQELSNSAGPETLEENIEEDNDSSTESDDDL